eukprot:TRINITY_DN1664_c0_g2_i3.p1 TRINITY_DN1664_c0_g2~~TRINITY_DN1664_c0_g2_i3.p1  ORF type:complete len:324 (-),score=20.83 TRINITY_DN1664_c0_g2_i3:190-1161(-)
MAEDAANPPKDKEAAAVGQAMDSLTSSYVEKAVDTSKARAAVEKLHESKAKVAEQERQRLRALAAVKVDKLSVQLVAQEFNISTKAADQHLRENDGDMKRTLRYLLNVGLPADSETKSEEQVDAAQLTNQQPSPLEQAGHVISVLGSYFRYFRIPPELPMSRLLTGVHEWIWRCSQRQHNANTPALVAQNVVHCDTVRKFLLRSQYQPAGQKHVYACSRANLASLRQSSTTRIAVSSHKEVKVARGTGSKLAACQRHTARRHQQHAERQKRGSPNIHRERTRSDQANATCLDSDGMSVANSCAIDRTSSSDCTKLSKLSNSRT